MRKIAILLTTILLTGGVFTSCENFLSGGKIKKDIDDQIALANAPAFPILIDGTKGKFSPSKGSYPLKVTQGMDISFESDTDFGFIRWEVFNARTGESLDTSEYIEIADSTSDKTSIKLLREPESEIQLGVRSVVSARPQIISYTPSALGMLKDSSIQVLFNRNMDTSSIYYSEKEREELKASEGISDGDFLSTMLGDETKYYGYTKGGNKFFKNIMITNNKTGDNINDRFGVPVFESPRTLSITASKESGHMLDDYTQVLVELEKGFFYTEQEKNVEMAGSKMWMYQVNNKTDDKPLVITNQNGSDLFTAKLSDETQLVQSASFAPNQSGFEGLRFTGDGKLDLDINVRDPDGGSGPNSYFTLNVKKLYGENYVDIGQQIAKSLTVDFQSVTSDEAMFEGRIDLEEEGFSIDEGVYELSFEFKDRSNNSMTYPSDGKFYFAVDTKAPEMNEPLVKSEDSSTYTFECNDCIDVKSAQIVYTKAGTEMIPVTMNKDSSDNRYRGEIPSIAEDTAYDIKIKYTDYAGNVSEETVPKFLTGIRVSGVPNFNAENASHIENLFFEGDNLEDYELSVLKYYSDGTTATVAYPSLSVTVPWHPEVICTEGYISKKDWLSSDYYYVVKKDALTQSIVKIDTYYFKFGDFPQSESNISSYSDSALYNGWYLGSDGYFYEKTDAGKYYKVEPIYWLLQNTNYDSGKQLLVAEKILTLIKFYGSQGNFTLDGKTIYPNSYPYSNIRSYLNGTDNQFVLSGGTRRTYDIDWTGKGFLQKAFTPSAQNLIATTKVGNAEISSNYPTSDKIFILSANENDANPKVRTGTDYCGANVTQSWSRSPYKDDYFGYKTAKFINTDGTYNTKKYTGYVDGVLGLVPALCVSASDLP